ncbi:hypothetical protein V8E54_002563 [Elaphomyces granulatus]
MSTEPLLPSYASATCRQSRDRSSAATQDFATPAASFVHGWSFVFFANAAIFSTIWASKGRETSDWDPKSLPLLPYFATLSVILALGCWVGYLFFIAYDGAGSHRILRKTVITTSLIGKLILGVTHLGFRYSYSVHLNWVVAFLAAQAWWDLLLLIMYSCLRVEARVE